MGPQIIHLCTRQSDKRCILGVQILEVWWAPGLSPGTSHIQRQSGMLRHLFPEETPLLECWFVLNGGRYSLVWAGKSFSLCMDNEAQQSVTQAQAGTLSTGVIGWLDQRKRGKSISIFLSENGLCFRRWRSQGAERAASGWSEPVTVTRALPPAEKQEGEYLGTQVSAPPKTRSGASVLNADNPKHQTGKKPGNSGRSRGRGGPPPRAHPSRAHGQSCPLPLTRAPPLPAPLPLESRLLNTWSEAPQVGSYLKWFNPLQVLYQSFNNSHGCFCEKPLS